MTLRLLLALVIKGTGKSIDRLRQDYVPLQKPGRDILHGTHWGSVSLDTLRFSVNRTLIIVYTDDHTLIGNTSYFLGSPRHSGTTQLSISRCNHSRLLPPRIWFQTWNPKKIPTTSAGCYPPRPRGHKPLIWLTPSGSWLTSP